MAIRPENDPYRPSPDMSVDDQEEIRRAASDENRSSLASRGTMIALGIALAMGIVFYALNSTPVGPTQSTMAPAPATTADRSATESSRPAVPPGVRDVMPYNNTQPGTTTGAAPTRPANPN